MNESRRTLDLRMSESCGTHDLVCVTWLINKSLIDESCYKSWMSHVAHLPYEWVSHVAHMIWCVWHDSLTSHLLMSHVTHMNESRRTLALWMSESCGTHDLVCVPWLTHKSHLLTSHVTHINDESCSRMGAWPMPLSHSCVWCDPWVTRWNEWLHTHECDHEWTISHTWRSHKVFDEYK